jgi:hypothetical protein
MIRVSSSAVLLVMASAGCFGSPFIDNTLTPCEDVTGCGDGQACAFGTCVALGDPRLNEVDIEIERASVMSLAVQSVFGVSIASGSVELAFRPVAQVPGVVRSDGEGAEAIVLAEPERRIAGRGRPAAVDAQTDGTFTLSLLEGSAYRLSALPKDVLRPALRDERIVASSISIDLNLPVVATTVFGRLVVGSEDTIMPVPAIAVELQDDLGALAAVTTTDDDGTFAFAVGTFTGGRLRITPPADSDLPQQDVDIVQADVGDISLGEVGPSQRVSGRILNDQGDPQPNTDVYIQGRVGAGVFRRQAVADDEGLFAIDLPTGAYRLASVTRDDAAGRAQLGVVDVLVADDEVTDVLLRLSTPAAVAGRVLAASGEAMVGTVVHLERVGDGDGVLEPVLLDHPAVLDVLVGNSDGSIAVAVPAGRYRVTLQPSLNSGAPVQSLLLTVPETGLQRDFTLPNRIALTGVVKDELGSPVPGATIRVYSQLVDERGRAIFLGEAIADGDGRMELPLPDIAASLRQ